MIQRKQKNNLSIRLKEKTKQLKEFERINKNLAEQLANIQSSSVPENVQKLKEDLE